MLPNFLIIGAQKSATTFVQMCLADHPQIFVYPKEISYFEDPDYHETSLEDFEALFNDADHEKAVGLKRASYLAKPECPARIKQLIPDALLIAILRNPIDRAVSAYFHNMSYGFLPLRSLEQGMRNLINGKYEEKYPRAHEVIEFGYFYKHLSRYYDFFGRKQILVLFYNDIFTNIYEQIQNIYRFLDVDETYISRNLYRRPQAVMYSLPRIRFRRIGTSFIYDYNHNRTRLYRKKQNRIDKLASHLVFDTDRVLLAKLFCNKKPVLSDELQNMLYMQYKDDIGNLEELLQVNLDHWKIGAYKE